MRTKAEAAEQKPRCAVHGIMDPLLLTLVLLLAATLTVFLAGWLPYPFGALVLALWIIARLLWLRGRRPR